MKNKRGFVHVAAMNTLIILAIIGITAAIAIPQYLNYRNRPLNEKAKVHARQVYDAAQAFFAAHPKVQPTREGLERYGYHGDRDIAVVIDGGKDTLSIMVWNLKGNKTYRVNARGEISD